MRTIKPRKTGRAQMDKGLRKPNVLTLLGRILASLVMITGYAIIAVPTGIMTVEMGHAFRRPITTQACPHCSLEGHEPDAKFCKHCGESLENA